MRFDRFLVAANASVPAGMIAFDAARGRLGVNPVELVTRATGTLTLLFLGLTLAVTPLRVMLHAPALGKHRRTLGLFTFFYGSAHLLVYVALDQVLDVREIAGDLVGRPFITVGALAWLLMVPMALTSTARAVKRVGPERWRRTHRRIYAVAVLAIVHFYLFAKADTAVPLATGAIFMLLLVWRWGRRKSPVERAAAKR